MLDILKWVTEWVGLEEVINNLKWHQIDTENMYLYLKILEMRMAYFFLLALNENSLQMLRNYQHLNDT